MVDGWRRNLLSKIDYLRENEKLFDSKRNTQKMHIKRIPGPEVRYMVVAIEMQWQLLN